MTAATPVLRDARWFDVPALAGLEGELFPHDAWPETTWWAELAARPRRDYVVLAGSEGVVGYAGLDHGGEVADVMTLAVAPTARGGGWGRVLLDELGRRARSRGAASVMLEVRADNAPALALYERGGYALVRTRSRYYQPGDVDALVLRTSLAEGGHGA